MTGRSLHKPSSNWHRRAVLYAGLALVGAVCTEARPAPAALRSPGAALVSSQPTLADRCRFRQPTGTEMQQFYNAFDRKGWRGTQIVAMPAGYMRQDKTVQPVDLRLATLYGDVDGDKKEEWVLGCYFQPGPLPPGMPPDAAESDRARIVIFKRESDHWEIAWRSPGLGQAFDVPQFNVREVQQGLDAMENLRPPLALLDIDGDRKLEIAYQAWLPNNEGVPGIYRFDGSRWVNVAPQADRFSIQDVDHDGKLMEVVTGSPFVGFGTGDDDVPRVWRWNGRQYQETSSQFPTYYGQLVSRYTTFVHGMEARGETFPRSAWARAIQKASSLAGQVAVGFGK